MLAILVQREFLFATSLPCGDVLSAFIFYCPSSQKSWVALLRARFSCPALSRSRPSSTNFGPRETCSPFFFYEHVGDFLLSLDLTITSPGTPVFFVVGADSQRVFDRGGFVSPNGERSVSIIFPIFSRSVFLRMYELECCISLFVWHPLSPGGASVPAFFC